MQRKENVKGKQLMKQPRYFCDLINGGLYQGKQRLRPDMIRAMPGMWIPGTLKQDWEPRLNCFPTREIRRKCRNM